MLRTGSCSLAVAAWYRRGEKKSNQNKQTNTERNTNKQTNNGKEIHGIRKQNVWYLEGCVMAILSPNPNLVLFFFFGGGVALLSVWLGENKHNTNSFGDEKRDRPDISFGLRRVQPDTPYSEALCRWRWAFHLKWMEMNVTGKLTDKLAKTFRKWPSSRAGEGPRHCRTVNLTLLFATASSSPQ